MQTSVATASRPAHHLASAEIGKLDVGRGLLAAIDEIGTRRSFTRNAEVYGENEPTEYVYKVISGTVRTYKIVLDGRRLVGAFHLPGDLFGLEAGERRLFSTEAVVDCELLVVKRDALMALAERSHAFSRELWTLTARDLRKAHNHMLLLNKSASERVASFLLEMSDRIAGSEEFRLSMSRQDVADYLGLNSETISRMLTRLQASATINLPTCRTVVLRNRSALKRLVA